MDASKRIRDHGYNLMSLASVGQFVCFFLLLWNLGVRSWDPGITAALTATEWRFFFVQAGAVWVSQLWTLSRLRAIGKLLHAGSGVSHPMARAWMALGKALVATAFAMAVPIGPRLAEPSGQLDLVLRLDAGGLYFVVIGCLCVFSVAHLLEQAALLRDDSEAIV